MTEISTSWHGIGKIYNLGHAALTELFHEDVIGEEKVDGSFFSFGIFDGELRCRSKGRRLVVDAPPKMFSKGVEAVQSISHLLVNGWTYRAEYLRSPKHNTLAYSRTPTNNIIIFDINTDHEEYLFYDDKKAEATRLGLEIVPLLFQGKIESTEQVQKLLETESILGGPMIEGIVFKNYKRFGADGKALMGKFVSEKFKEQINIEWKRTNPGTKDIISLIGSDLRTEARWHKSIQHLRDNGELTGTPKDIGSLIKEIGKDVKEECSEEIKAKLFQYAWPKIQRIIINGFPEWYKEQLMENQFAESESTDESAETTEQ